MFTYQVKVPALIRRYLMGSASVQKAFDEDHSLIFRANDEGNPLKIGRSHFDVAGNVVDEVLVTALQPGESYIVNLKGYQAVWAECSFDTIVQCAVFQPD